MPVPNCVDEMDGKVSLLLMITQGYSITVVLWHMSFEPRTSVWAMAG
jgi:hypothetical protein